MRPPSIRVIMAPRSLRSRSGGKGTPAPEVVEFSYSVSLAVALGEGVTRVTVWGSLYAAAIQALNVTSDDAKFGGTGLGLAVVKKIADEHGARVRIVNRRADPVAAADGVPAEGAVIGAQVSLSFSRFAPAQALPAGAQAIHAPDMPAPASPQNPAPATASRAAQG